MTGNQAVPAGRAGSAPAASLLVIFLVALAVRVIHIWQIRRAPFFGVLMGDSHGYDAWAQQIAKGDWIGHEVFYQAPLYPYFLGVVYATIGRDLLLVRVIQAIIGSGSCALVASAARRLFSPAAGLVAGLMLALYAPAIFFDGLLQKSVLDVFFVCLALWLIAGITVRLKADTTGDPDIARSDIAQSDIGRRNVDRRDINRPNINRPNIDRPDIDRLNIDRPDIDRPNIGSVRLQPDFLSLGLALGGLSLTRENALVLIVVILAWIVATVGARAKAAGAFALGLAIVIVPVSARNSRLGGGFYITTSQFGPNFFIGNHAGADGSYQSLRYGRGAPEYEREDATALAEHALRRALTPAEVSAYWTGRAVDFITSQPGAWMKLMARKTALLVNATEMVDTEDQGTHADWSLPLRLAGPVGHFGALVPLATLGVMVTWRDRRRFAVLYALILTYAASVVVFYVFARYRYPLVPLLVPFAAEGVVSVAREGRRVSRDWGHTGAGRGHRSPLRRAEARASRAEQAPPRRAVLVVIAVAIVANWPIESAAAMRAVTETNLGAAFQTDHKLDEAIAHYRRAIRARPDYAPAYSNLATALRDAKRLDEAIAAYQQALRLQPEFAAAHYNFANLLLDEGDAAGAADHFQRALGTEPASAEVHNNLGVALAGLGRVEEALAEFRQAIALDPKSADARRNLGDALSTAGRPAEAIDALRRAADLGPSDAAIRYDLASALLDAGRLDEAIAELRATLELAPNFVEAHNNLGIALGSQGKLDDAIAQFRQALAIQPDFADAKRNLATALDARRHLR